MKHRIQRTLSASVLLCALIAASACGSEAAAEPTDTKAAAPAQETAAETEQTSYHADYLPEVSYGGYAFRLVGYDEYPGDIETETGNLINDAVYSRNRTVEERYDVKITEKKYSYANFTDVYTSARQSGLAQSDDADLYNLVFSNAYSGVIEGIIPPASYLPVIDLSQPWYFHAMNDGLSINGVQLVAYTAFDRTPGGSCLLFNKKLMAELDLELPYALVDSGTWTYDAFYDMAKAGISDLDGDGKMTVADRWALAAPIDDITDFAYYGAGQKLVNFDSTGTPYVSQEEVLFDMFAKALDRISADGFFLNVSAVKGAPAGTSYTSYQLFSEGHSLFAITRTSALVQLGDMADDYGVLPYPKWTEDQKMHYNAPDGSRIMVPLASSADLERVCVIKEALAVESLNINYPAYYEVSLKNRYVRDEDSVRMLDIITSGVTYDVGCAMDYNAIRGPWLNCMEKGKNDFISAVTKNLSKAQKVIDKLLENTEEIKNLYE